MCYKLEPYNRENFAPWKVTGPTMTGDLGLELLMSDALRKLLSPCLPSHKEEG